MSEREPQAFSAHEYWEHLVDTTHDDFYKELAGPDKPLSYEDLLLTMKRYRIRMTDLQPHFMDTVAVVDVLGWPGEEDGRKLVPRKHYRGGVDDFIDNFGAEITPWGLNSFHAYLQYQPLTPAQVLGEQPIEDPEHPTTMYRAAPWAIRAHIIAPDLMDGLQVLLKDKQPQDIPDYLRANPDVGEAAHMAYQLMGRLVRADDRRIQADLLGFDPEGVSDISDVHRALTE